MLKGIIKFMYEPLYYPISIQARNAGDTSWMCTEEFPARNLNFDLRIKTPAHGWRHIDEIRYHGCLVKITYLDDDSNGWCFYKNPDSLVTVEIPDEGDYFMDKDDYAELGGSG